MKRDRAPGAARSPVDLCQAALVPQSHGLMGFYPILASIGCKKVSDLVRFFCASRLPVPLSCISCRVPVCLSLRRCASPPDRLKIHPEFEHAVKGLGTFCKPTVNVGEPLPPVDLLLPCKNAGPCPGTGVFVFMIAVGAARSLRYRPANTSSAAWTVASSCSRVWAAETNMASNWAGARATPRWSIPVK